MAQEEAARWRCANRDCNFFMVAATVEAGKTAPRCICGGEMRRTEAAPMLNYLGFLRSETAAIKEAEVDKE